MIELHRSRRHQLTLVALAALLGCAGASAQDQTPTPSTTTAPATPHPPKNQPASQEIPQVGSSGPALPHHHHVGGAHHPDCPIDPNKVGGPQEQPTRCKPPT